MMSAPVTARSPQPRLPGEIWAMIFSRVQGRDRLRVLRRCCIVCREWKDYAQHELLQGIHVRTSHQLVLLHRSLVSGGDTWISQQIADILFDIAPSTHGSANALSETKYIQEILACTTNLRGIEFHERPAITFLAMSAFRQLRCLVRLNATLKKGSYGIFAVLNRLTTLEDLTLRVRVDEGWDLLPCPALLLPRVSSFCWHDDKDFKRTVDQGVLQYLHGCRVHPHCKVYLCMMTAPPAGIRGLAAFLSAHTLSTLMMHLPNRTDLQPLVGELMRIPRVQFSQAPPPAEMFVRPLRAQVVTLCVWRHNPRGFWDLMGGLHARRLGSEPTQFRLLIDGVFKFAWAAGMDEAFVDALLELALPLERYGVTIVDDHGHTASTFQQRRRARADSSRSMS